MVISDGGTEFSVIITNKTELNGYLYSQWSEDEMLSAIEERSQYRESCSFYVEVIEYMENIREARDVSIVVNKGFI